MAYFFSGQSHTFNEYLLVPGYSSSECIPDNVSLRTPLTRFRAGEEPALSLNVPMVSAVMQSVSGDRLAVALAQAGADVLGVTYAAAAPETAAAIAAAGRRYVHVQADLSSLEPIQGVIDAALAAYGRIDILVNNAGIIKRIPMHEMKREEFQQVIDIDLVGPFIVSSAVLPEMMERREGKIINICSMMSELGRETVSAYAAAKGGLKMLTRNICSEYGEYNIQCNGIGPGYIATPQTAPLRERQADGSRHPFDSFIVAKTPAGRWLEPSELGGPAVFLASHASDAINGHVLYVDGGILAYIGKQPK